MSRTPNNIETPSKIKTKIKISNRKLTNQEFNNIP